MPLLVRSKQQPGAHARCTEITPLYTLKDRAAVTVLSGSSLTRVRERAQVYAKLVEGHKSGVTGLASLGAREEGGPDLLLSCAGDGAVALWEPSAAAPAGPDKEVRPKVRMNPASNPKFPTNPQKAAIAGIVALREPSAAAPAGPDKEVRPKVRMNPASNPKFPTNPQKAAIAGIVALWEPSAAAPGGPDKRSGLKCAKPSLKS